jgi:nucleoside-diphosphate-sugar epimerase
VREGDLLDATTLPGAVEGVRTVLHLAGLVGVPDPERNRRAHVDATRNLLLASRAAGVERLVVLSSDTVLRRQLSAYARSKVEMEALLRAEAGGIDVVVLRPAMILGPGSRHEASLLRLARLPMLPLPQGLPPRAPVRVDDVALAVLTAALLPRDALPPDPVALFGPVDLDWPALVAHVARSHGLPAPRVIPIPPRVPASFARLAVRAGFAALGERLLGLREGVPIDREPARTWLQFQPRPL